jgi:hypothetical protein
MEACVIPNAMITAFYYSEIRHIIPSICPSNLFKDDVEEDLRKLGVKR